MKTAILSAIFITSLVGCGTAPTSTIATTPVTSPAASQPLLDPQQVAAAIKDLGTPGVKAVIRHDPNSKAYFQSVLIVLQSTTMSGVYDPNALDISLAAISVKELRTAEADDVVKGILNLYRDFVGKAVSQNLDGTVWILPVLIAARDAIADGVK